MAVNVVISGVDKLTGTLDKVTEKVEAAQKAWAKTTSPFTNAEESVHRLAEATGLSEVGDAFHEMAEHAGEAAKSVAEIVEPLAAITAAASFAGIYKLVSVWANFRSQLGFTAQGMNVTASELGSLDEAAQIAGAHTGALTAGMGNLATILTNAVGGIAPDTVVLFNSLGLSIYGVGNQAANAADMLPQIADKIASIRDPIIQARVAMQAFGASGRDMLPFLRLGSAGIRDLQEAAERLNPVTQESVNAANEFRIAQTKLELAVDGLGNRLAEKLAPTIGPMLEQMANWIATNPQVEAGIEAIAHAVQHFGERMGQFDWVGFGDDIVTVGGDIKEVVDDLGGVRRVTDAILIMMATRFAFDMLAPWGKLIGTLVAVTAKIWGITAAEEGAAAAAVTATAASETAAVAQGALEEKLAVAGAARIGRLITMFRLMTSAYAGYALVNAADGDDKVGDWIDRNVPGASFIDNAASKVGMGRSYAQQEDWNRGHAAMAGSSRPSSAEQARDAADAVSYFMTRGYTRAQASGIAANIEKESGFNPSALGDSGNAHGLAQWHMDRIAPIEEHFGKQVSQMSRREQLDAINWEMSSGGPEAAAGRRLRQTTTADEAGAAVSMFYERPGDKMGEAADRAAMATRIFNRDPGPVVPALPGDPNATFAPTATGPTASPVPSVYADAVKGPGGGGGSGGSVDMRVNITHANTPPPGSDVSITSVSGQVLGLPVKAPTVAQSNVSNGVS